MPRQIPKIGDVFLIAITENVCAVGQILEIEPILMNSITCAFFGIEITNEVDPIDIVKDNKNAISCQFVTRDLFNKGIWKRIGNCDVHISEEMLPYRETRKNRWIGAKVLGSGIIDGFLKAYFGFGDWKEMKDPEYYQKLMISGIMGPKCA